MLLGWIWITATPALSQSFPAGSLIYNQFDMSTGRPLAQLYAITEDGSTKTPIAVDLKEPGFPARSRDGRLVAVTAPDPGRAFTLSRDIYLLDLAKAGLTRLTSFPNVWEKISTNTGQLGVLEANGAQYTLPWYKAFSPDSTKLAVSSYVVAASRVSFPTSGLGEYTLQTGSTTTPTLSVYDLGTRLPLLVAVGTGADVHAGEGVDWSPDGSLLVWPYMIKVPYGGGWPFGGQILPVTALFLLPPANEGLASSRSRQLTFPRGEAGILPDYSGNYIQWETDYLPAFSPDGRRVAYVRAVSFKPSTIAGFYSQASLRIAAVDGSKDEQVALFQVGQYVSHVAWSPDGSQLVFDVGSQVVGAGGLPYSLADPASDALYVLRTDGTGLRKLCDAPATWAVWAPANAVGGADPVALAFAPSARRDQVQFSWPDGSVPWVLESSPRLGAQAVWSAVTGSPSRTGGKVTLSLGLTNAASASFFRLRSP